MTRRLIAQGALALTVICCALPSRAAVQKIIPVIDSPVRLVAPLGDSRLFVVSRTGQIRVFDQQGVALGTFLDVTSQTTTEGERGLVGLAFAPDYATSGRFYVVFSDLQGDFRLARYLVSGVDPNLALEASQEIILTVTQPGQDHNGGNLEFGPDGMLYVGLGDGEYGGDPGNRAQDPQSLLGKMLRLDVSVPTGYAVPADNPFVGLPPRDEIWSLGLRNPWCFTFDRLTGDLYIADVGETVWEEINIQPAGSTGAENYGWRLMAGPDCFNPNFGCLPNSLTLPAYAYTHAGSTWRCAISGGFVYRGEALPSLQGHYFFSDYCSNQILSVTWTEAGGVGPVIDHSSQMTPSGNYTAVSSFGQDGLGALYVIDFGAGSIYRVVSAVSDVPVVSDGLLLAQNSPNPFNPRTEIAFAVGRSNEETTLVVYDAAGRKVRTLVSRLLAAGDHSVSWDGTDDHGGRVPSGVYLYQLQSGGELTSRKMLLLE